MLTDLIADIRDQGGVERAIMDAGDLVLLADTARSADTLGRSIGAFAVMSLTRFIERADDEDWASLMSAMNGGNHPAESAIVHVLRQANRDVADLRR